jgi:hypothetical protein
MGSSCSKNKVNPIPPDLEIINILYKYNIFTDNIIYIEKITHLTQSICAEHKAFHEKYEILRVRLQNPTLHDVQFYKIFNTFTDDLVYLYEKGKLTIEPVLLESEQVRKIFHIDNNL